MIFVPVLFCHILIWLISNWLSSVWSWRFQHTNWFYWHSLSVSWSSRWWLLNIWNKGSSINIWILELVSILIIILRVVSGRRWELVNRFSGWRFTITILFTIRMSVSAISTVATITTVAAITTVTWMPSITWMSITISWILSINNRIFQIMTNVMLILYSLIFDFSHDFFLKSTHMSRNFLFNFLFNELSNSFSHIIWNFFKFVIKRCLLVHLLVPLLFKTFNVVFLMIHSEN